jgi:hypothetical protein
MILTFSIIIFSIYSRTAIIAYPSALAVADSMLRAQVYYKNYKSAALSANPAQPPVTPAFPPITPISGRQL